MSCDTVVMKILYGVVGEGMGHATRSGVILDHLATAGHEVRIVVSGRAAKYLEARHPGTVTEITGLTMHYEDNEVHRFKTALQNLKAVIDLPDNLRAYLKMARDFTPDVVISDFESWSYVFARGQRIPVISLDNMQVIARCFHEQDVLGDDLTSFLLAKGLVKAKLPKCNSYLISTFFFPRVKKPRTTLHPPILRPVVREAKARVQSGDHVVVYQTGGNNPALLETLRSLSDVPFRIYGMRREITEDQTEGNLSFRPFSEAGFVEDLATSRAVVAGGGFTLMGEAVFLGKPMLSVPLVGQFEQTINAMYLQKLGYGAYEKAIDRENLRDFLSQTERYRENLQAFESEAHERAETRLDRALEEAKAEGPLG